MKQSLREARDEIKQFSADAKAALAAVKNASETVETARDRIEEQEVAATKLIGSIGKAYSAATSAGLGRAFTERANALNGSTWVWVGMLVAALMSGGYIGFLRLEALQTMLTQPLAKPEYVWLNATMTLFSIAGPVWFAWIATRQISQRFRLAEDYGFKASVARAYEGYRMEAARVDPEFEARLFASALDRLEEAPLRFLSVEEHGSPYEALLASTGFQKALDRFPDVRATFLAMAERIASVTKPEPAPTPLKNIPDQAEK